MHPTASDLPTVSTADSHGDADLDEVRIAVAERHENIRGAHTAVDVAVIAHEVGAVRVDLSGPPAWAIDR